MIRHLLLFALFAGALLVVPGIAGAHDRRPNPHPHPRPQPPSELVSMRVEDAQGHALRTFSHGATTYVLGSRGQRYNIRVTNHSADRLETVVSVDGRDVLHGRSSHQWRDRGYIVPAGGSVLVKGYRTTMTDVAAFRFSSPGESYAGRQGQAHSVGVIRLAAYRERAEPVFILPQPRPHTHWDDDHVRPAPRPRARDKRPAAGDAAAGETVSRSDRQAVPPQHWDHRRWSNLGTEFGEQTRSQAMETRFERANRQRPDQRLTLRYDDAAGLEALGVVVRRAPPPPPVWIEPVVAVEPRFAQPPPPLVHWHWH